MVVYGKGLPAAPSFIIDKKHESYYQEKWCNAVHGITEWVLPCKARVDCVTATHAVEFDFAKKWAEAIGQSLYYASQTGKRAGIVLISRRNGKDTRYWLRLQRTIDHFDLPIDFWVIYND